MIQRLFLSLTIFLILLESADAQQLLDRIRADLRGLGRKTLVQKKPLTGRDTEIEKLAREIDWLESHIDKFGSVVAKQPDVWGESRLTKYRREYELEMAKRLGGFKPRINADRSRVDLAAFASATGLNTPIPAAPQMNVSASSTTDDGNGQMSGTSSSTGDGGENSSPAGENAGGSDNATTINQTISFDGLSELTTGNQRNVSSLGITEELDQRSRYINHLHQLRRISSADDVSNSPGYSLNLVRIPVSINPGRLTRRGYGAEVTITATPMLTNTLLPQTFKNLVVNDLVDQLSLPILRLAEKDEIAIQKYAADFNAVYADVNRRQEETFAAIIADPTITVSQALNRIYGYTEYQDNVAASDRYIKSLLQALSLILEFDGNDIPKKKKIEIENLIKNIEFQYSILKTKAYPNPNDTFSEFLDRLVDQNNSQSSGVSLSGQNSKKAGGGQNKTKQQLDERRQQQQTEMSSKLADIGNSFESISGKLEGLSGWTKINPISQNRRSVLPIPQVLLADVLDERVLVNIAYEFRNSYKGRLVAWNQAEGAPRIHLPDVRNFLQSSLESAYQFLVSKNNLDVVKAAIAEHGGVSLCEAIKEGRLNVLEEYRIAFNRAIDPDSSISSTGQPQPEISPIMRALAWPVLVEMALLNDQLNKDIHNVSVTRGDCGCHPTRNYAYYLPMPVSNQPELVDEEFRLASEQFIKYVRCRWPIHVFHVDPVNEDQNVADSSVLGRELAIAVAIGVAKGNINFRQANQFVRQYRESINTVALNRTVSGFSHGDDTFGWTFRPRVQTHPNRGTFKAFGETVFGRTADANNRDAELEPGMKECTAVVLMPSFVPFCEFDVATRWFRLDNPRSKELSTHATMKLSRSVRAMQECSIQCAQCAHLYRDGETQRLLKRVEQLEKELPLQTMQVQIPYENTAGGFELFSNGVTDFAPELFGWYGAPGVSVGDGDTCCPEACPKDCGEGKKDEKSPCSHLGGTTLFLVGENFNVHETRIVAGGYSVPSEHMTLISRHVIQVTIPGCVQLVRLEDSNGVATDFVAVYMSTPYGVTSHLHIPVIKREAEKKEDATAKAIQDLGKKVDAVIQYVSLDDRGTFTWSGPDTLPVAVSYSQRQNGSLARTDVELGRIGTAESFKLQWESNLSSLVPGEFLIAGQFELGGKLLGKSFWIQSPDTGVVEQYPFEITAESLLAQLKPAIESDLSLDKIKDSENVEVTLRTWVVEAKADAGQGPVRIIGQPVLTTNSIKVAISRRLLLMGAPNWPVLPAIGKSAQQPKAPSATSRNTDPPKVDLKMGEPARTGIK